MSRHRPTVQLLSPAQLVRARRAGELLAVILRRLKDRTIVGTNLLDIDEWTGRLIRENDAESCYVDYAPSFGDGPFGHYICTSVNDAALHGRPHDYTVADGDLITLDLAILHAGYAADSALSFIVGTPDPADLAMIDATERALAAGINAARPGAHTGDISHAVGSTLTRAGYRVNGDFGGHGIGSTMHQDPSVPNLGRPGHGHPLRPGLLLAIEPWVMADTDALVVDRDGWTLRSATGGRAAHSEHTIAITRDGPEILTLPPAQETANA